MRRRPSTFVVLADQSYLSSWFFLPPSLLTVDGENSLSSQRNLWLWLFSGYPELDCRAVPCGYHRPWLDGAICAFVHGGGHVIHLGGRGGYRASGLQDNFGACSWNWSRRSGPWFSFDWVSLGPCWLYLERYANRAIGRLYGDLRSYAFNCFSLCTFNYSNETSRPCYIDGRGSLHYRSWVGGWYEPDCSFRFGAWFQNSQTGPTKCFSGIEMAS